MWCNNEFGLGNWMVIDSTAMGDCWDFNGNCWRCVENG